MSKSKRREDLLAVGTIVLLLGVLALFDGITRPLTLDSIATKVTEIIGGGFITIIGAYICCWGISDEAGRNASEFLKSIWNRFLEALGK